MTNNINGIDVSECSFSLEHEGKQKCATGFGVICDCENLYNCYFKQFKRLQKENEELKARLKTLDDEILTIEITLDEFERHKKYKQALEEIREITNECITDCMGSKCEGMEEIQNKINEALNDRD